MRLPEFFHHRLKIPYCLHVERRGRRGPLLICLHGLAANNQVWDPTTAELSQHYRCVQLDLLGHGRSPKPTWLEYTPDDHARSVRWTLFWRGLWGRKILLTHSMGGLIAIRYARRWPRSLTRLVLIGLPIYQSRSPEMKLRRLEAMINQNYLRFYRVLRAIPKSAALRSVQVLLMAMPRLKDVATLDETTWYPVVSSLAHTIEDQTALKDLAYLHRDLPIFLLYGQHDRLIMVKNLKAVSQRHKNTQLIAMPTSHELNHKSIRPIIRAVSQEG